MGFAWRGNRFGVWLWEYGANLCLDRIGQLPLAMHSIVEQV